MTPATSFDSYRYWVEDSAGRRYLFTLAANRPGSVEASQRHCRDWMRLARSRGYRREMIRRGQFDAIPSGRCRVVVEFYNEGA